jgi:hypothetical protein
MSNFLGHGAVDVVVEVGTRSVPLPAAGCGILHPESGFLILFCAGTASGFFPGTLFASACGCGESGSRANSTPPTSCAGNHSAAHKERSSNTVRQRFLRGMLCEHLTEVPDPRITSSQTQRTQLKPAKGLPPRKRALAFTAILPPFCMARVRFWQIPEYPCHMDETPYIYVS